LLHREVAVGAIAVDQGQDRKNLFVPSVHHAPELSSWKTNSKFRASERLISADEYFSFEKRTHQNISLDHDVQCCDEYFQIDHQRVSFYELI